jgi:hypothetical protein
MPHLKIRDTMFMQTEVTRNETLTQQSFILRLERLIQLIPEQQEGQRAPRTMFEQITVSH